MAASAGLGADECRSRDLVSELGWLGAGRRLSETQRQDAEHNTAA
ncbi:MAG: hypothetical protein ACU0DI_15890 [Paracoccaceae bacterium]